MLFCLSFIFFFIVIIFTYRAIKMTSDEQAFTQEDYVPVTAGLKEMGKLPDAFNRPFDHTEVVQHRIDLDFDDQAFYLDNIMSEDECKAVIAFGEAIGYGPVETDCKKECTARKVMATSEPFTKVLFERLRLFLKDIDISSEYSIHKLHLEGNSFAMQGQWKPEKLDTVFRLSRYTEGGHFKPHFDGFYADPGNPTLCRTMKSLVFYLNSPADGCGGNTNFLDENVKQTDGSPAILQSVQPKPGRVLVFNHRSLHESVPTDNSVKYIIRSDVMYKRHSFGGLSENDLQAIDFLNRAEQFEVCLHPEYFIE